LHVAPEYNKQTLYYSAMNIIVPPGESAQLKTNEDIFRSSIFLESPKKHA